ncbi:hypothetical protein [Candidatus Nitrospira bockiana]
MIRIRKADWVFVVAVVVVVLFVSLLPSPRERNPPVPMDAEHRGATTETLCSQCHAPQGARPLGPRHPKRQDCFKCHRRADASSS